MLLKTKSKLLNEKWDDLCDILLDMNKFNYKKAGRLEKLGYRVEWGKHPKMYISLDKTYVVTLCCTPGDFNAGRQNLRRIRKVYEEYELGQ